MKYCPKCGTQIDDEAKFCPKCGTPQPGFETQKREEKVEEPAEYNILNDTKVSDAEKFKYLMENDEMFRDIYQVSRKKRFFNFINFAYLIPFFICTLSPIGFFTGNNVHPDGAAIFDAMGWSFPHSFSPITLQSIKTLMGSKALCPNSSVNGIVPIMLFIFGLILIPLIAVFTALGSPKSYYLKTYLKPIGGKAELLQYAKQKNGFFMGVVGCILGFIAMFNVWIGIAGLDYPKAYENNGGKLYLFGEISDLTSSFIAGTIVTIIFVVLIVVGIVIPSAIVTKKLNKYQ